MFYQPSTDTSSSKSNQLVSQYDTTSFNLTVLCQPLFQPGHRAPDRVCGLFNANIKCNDFDWNTMSHRLNAVQRGGMESESQLEVSVSGQIG